ncbi:MAG: TlpA family protein disulfide reductase, partial [Alistipes sp.]|nr:TlpA family protein disulfide reductase [Alistipes sp.]
PTPEQATIVKDGHKAPDFEVQMFDGSTIKLADLKGKVVLLNFWATWCPPCRAELARVEKDIIERFKGETFVFIPVSRGEKRETVAAFREKMGYTFPMGLDTESSIYKKYAETYIPRNFLIDKSGKVVKASVGYDEAEFAELIKLIEETIKK